MNETPKTYTSTDRSANSILVTPYQLSVGNCTKKCDEGGEEKKKKKKKNVFLALFGIALK